MYVIANHMIGVQFSSQPFYYNLGLLDCLIGGMVDALVSKTNPNKGIGSSPMMAMDVL